MHTRFLACKSTYVWSKVDFFCISYCSSGVKYDDNLGYIKNTAAIMSRCGTLQPNLQLKMTAFMPASVVVSTVELITI